MPAHRHPLEPAAYGWSDALAAKTDDAGGHEQRDGGLGWRDSAEQLGYPVFSAEMWLDLRPAAHLPGLQSSFRPPGGASCAKAWGLEASDGEPAKAR
jgi:hypothetical protein